MYLKLRQVTTIRGCRFGRGDRGQRGVGFALLVAVWLLGGTASAATLTTDDGMDPGIADDGLCSLREAVAAINIGADDTDDCANSAVEAYGDDDRITFDPALDGTPLLLDGQMQIDVPLTIIGNGAAATVLDAQQIDRFFIVPPSTAGNFTLRGLTLSNGNTGGAGGAIRYAPVGILTIEDSTLSGNSTSGAITPGGAIYAEAGEVVIRRSILSGNSTEGLQAFGGAIRAAGAPVTIEESALTGNFTTGVQAHGGAIRTTSGVVSVIGSTLADNSTAGTNADGGAISTDTGPVIVVDSTLNGNATTGDSEARGGAISAFAHVAQLTVSNSTLSDNSAVGDGGAAYVGGDTTLTNSTVVGNESTEGIGGGIYTDEGALTALNAILAQNNDGSGANDLDIEGVLTLSHSLIGINTGTDLVEAPVGSPDANGNLIGGPVDGAIDPQLGPLADNGGPTRTLALLPGSPAIDAADDAVSPPRRSATSTSVVTCVHGTATATTARFATSAPTRLRRRPT
jgi:hypothetical protein